MLPSRDLLQTVISIAREAGSQIMAVYEQGDDLQVSIKTDDSPLTQADLRANKTILSALRKLTPDVPVLSEESDLPPYDIRKTWHTYWLVDPLDGTKEFISRNGEFTVNIALIQDGQPVLGVVYVPVSGVTYAGMVSATESGAWKIPRSALPVFDSSNAIAVSPLPDTPDWSSQVIRVVASRRHGGAELEKLLQALSGRVAKLELLEMGSSLKICLVAEGKADFYPRLAPTSEWDIAAAHALLRGAGGNIVTTAFKPLYYNQKSCILNAEFFVIGSRFGRWERITD